MIPAHLTLGGMRVWYVPDVQVWGTQAWGDLSMLMVENSEGTRSLMYHAVDIGGSSQEMLFSSLRDFRGNQLPQSIANPRVMICPRSAYTAFPVGSVSNKSFRIARDLKAAGPVTVDLLILEMGE